MVLLLLMVYFRDFLWTTTPKGSAVSAEKTRRRPRFVMREWNDILHDRPRDDDDDDERAGNGFERVAVCASRTRCRYV